MATQIDRLQTVLIATGQTSYRRAMSTSALATKALGMANTQAATADLAHASTAQAATVAVTGQGVASLAAATATLVAAEAEVEMARATVLANLTSTNLAGTLAALTAAEATAAVAAVELAAAETAAAAGAVAVTSATGPLLLVLGPLAIAATVVGVAMLAISAAAVTLGGAGAGGFIAVTKSAKDFEAIMKDVELQSGATADEIEQIVDVALSVEMTAMGKSGSNAGAMLKRLAAEGLGVVKMKNVLIPLTQAVIVLGEDEAETTKLMLNVMEQFKIETQDASRVTDAFANALSNTSFQGDELSTVLGTVGADAAAAGLSLEAAIVLTDQIMKSFGDASRTGTGFRGLIASLKSPTDEMNDAFVGTGVTVAQLAAALDDPIELVLLLNQAVEGGLNVYKAFERRVASAALVLADALTPRMKEQLEAMRNVGFGAEFAQEKMKTLAGSLDALTAAWDSLKISLGLFTQVLGTDYVMGTTLALEATVEFVRQIRELSDTHEQTTEEMMGRQRGFAETFIKTFFGVTRAVAIAGFALIEYGKILRTILIASAVLQPVTAGPILAAALALKKLSEVGWERGKENAREYLDEIDRVEAGIISALDVVVAKRLEIFAPTGGGPGRAPGEKLALGKTREELQAEFALETAEIIEEQIELRKRLAFFSAQEDILASEAIEKAQIELVFRTADLRRAKEILAVLVERGAEEEKRAAAADDVNEATLAAMRAEVGLAEELADATEEYADNVDKATRGWMLGHLAMAKTAKNLEMQAFWYRQILFYLREQAIAAAAANDWATWGKLQQEMARNQEKMFKLAERERMKSARDYDRLIKQGDSVRDAIQMVIGGTLGQGIQEAIGRISGAGMRQAIGPGAVRAVGTNEIRVVVDIAGIGEEGKRQITDHFLGVLEEGATRLPALAY